MDEFYSLLREIQRIPGMYIGAPSVSDLFMFLCGYQYARFQQNIPAASGELEFSEFQPWLQAHYKLSSSASWAKIILLYSTTEAQGFETFYKLLDEFLIAKGQDSALSLGQATAMLPR